jgi:hypothetical protein
MAFIPVPQCALARIKFEVGLVKLDASIGLWFQRETFTTTEMNALADDLDSDFVTDLSAIYTNACKAKEIKIYDMRAEDGAVVTKAISRAGTGGDLPLSPAVSACVTFQNTKRGRWNRGRNYVPGLDEDWCDEIDIQQAKCDAIAAVYENTLMTGLPAGWTWVVVSRHFDHAPRAAGVYVPVTSVSIRTPRFAFQRRRAQRS